MALGPPSDRARSTAWYLGRSRVARTLVNWLRVGARIPGASLRPVEVNASPGALLVDGEGRLIAVWTLDMAEGAVTAINSVVNPDKLGHLGPLAELSAILRPGRPSR